MDVDLDWFKCDIDKKSSDWQGFKHMLNFSFFSLIWLSNATLIIFDL